MKLEADAQQLVDEYNREVETYNKALREWKSAIRLAEEQTYRKQMTEATDKAKDLATKAADVDIAVFRGRGPAFVLEFTAIVVIIFAAVILGILGPLKGDQIGTLLAAIAGYVLGKATSGGKGELEKVQPAPVAAPPAAPTAPTAPPPVGPPLAAPTAPPPAGPPAAPTAAPSATPSAAAPVAPPKTQTAETKSEASQPAT